MNSHRQIEGLLLLLGDIAIFTIALWITLAVRYLSAPSSGVFFGHLVPFSILFAVWALIFLIAGLYETRGSLLKGHTIGLILRTQTFNVVIAAVFFFLIPYFGITPKTNLLIYLVVSFLLILVWRLYVAPYVGVRKRKNMLVIAEGDEIDELIAGINAHTTSGICIRHHFRPKDIEHSPELQSQILEFIRREDITLLAADTRDENINQLLPIIYNLLFLETKITFIDTTQLYESLFSRIPVSSMKYSWFFEHIELGPRILYDAVHRLLDVLVAGVLLVPSVIIHVVVLVAIKLDDGGPVLYIHERVGKNNIPIRMYKYRSMVIGKEEVTTFGSFMRKTRIDELPQLWNVLRGDLSLIGPRPELPHLVSEYVAAIPYYNARHLITPGLSGWAQINDFDVPKRAKIEVEKTMRKLSYDLYYIKHRSVFLDIFIALKTLKALITRSGT